MLFIDARNNNKDVDGRVEVEMSRKQEQEQEQEQNGNREEETRQGQMTLKAAIDSTSVNTTQIRRLQKFLNQTHVRDAAHGACLKIVNKLESRFEFQRQ